jgi:hypothetical protein
MAEKLSITIALEGGKEIQKQLADIGEEGQKAFQKIAAEAAKTGGLKNLKPEEVTQKLKDMGITGVDALNKITAAVAQATKLESLVGVVQSLEAGFATLATTVTAAAGPVLALAVAIGTTLYKAATSAAEAINKIDTAAIKAGVSIETFDKISETLKRAGISAGAASDGIQKLANIMEQAKVDKVNQALKTIQDRPGTGLGSAAWNVLTEAVQGVGPAADAARAALEKLGATNIPESPVTKIRDMIGATTDMTAAAKGTIAALEKMPDGLQRNATAAAVLGDKLGTEVVQSLRTGSLTAEQFDKVVDTLSQSWANAANSYEQSNNKFMAAWDRFKTTGDVGELGKMWTLYSDYVSTSVDVSIKQIDELIKKIGELGATSPTGGGGTPGGPEPAPGHALGGLIGGSGSGTSDSNLAWVSRGEHIMPASVVRQPGVLALLEALRHGSGIGRFALGGVVPGLPRFADGGLVGHLGTVDLRTDHGSVRLMAGASAVDQLSRLAVTRRMTSTGRKPGFVG